jgi:uncharacterized repeat protein (TIGR03803 family)
LIATAILSSASPTGRAGEYSFANLATFAHNEWGTVGGGVTLNAQGDVFGTRYGVFSGSTGSVFKIDGQSGSPSTLATFNGANGANPSGKLSLDAQGNVYGATAGGGADSLGTVYKIDAQTGTLSTLAAFAQGFGLPLAGVTLDAQGNLYGTTTHASGASSAGVFKLDAATGQLTALADLGDAQVYGVAVDAGNNVYGALGRGVDDAGSIFAIDGQTGAYSTLHSFSLASNGQAGGVGPYSSVALDAQGDLYGTTYAGGQNGFGVVFKIDGATGAYSVLADLASGSGRPSGTLTFDAQGNIYGTEAGLGFAGSFGSIFRIDAQTGLYETLFAFDGINGGNVLDGVTLDAQGDIYGTTRGYYSEGRGFSTVFRLSRTTAAVPEPASLALLAVGAGAVGLLARRRA